MRKLILPVAIGLSLTACSTMHETFRNHDNDYNHQTNTLANTRVPGDLSDNTSQPYYPIPSVSANTNGTVNTIPPGSNLLTPLATTSAARQPAPRTTSVTASSSSAVVVNLNYDQAWGAVGKALRATGYKVMQQDKSIGGYYIVDVASTGGKLQTTTPIYQVHLQASGNNTTITVLNDKNSAADVSVSGRILNSLKQQL